MTAIAYLVSDYYAASHTFVRREVESLRRLKQNVLPISIHGGIQERNEAVLCVLGQSPWYHMMAGLCHLLFRPKRFFATWTLALRHRPPGLRGLLWSQFHFVEASTLATMLRENNVRHLHSHFANSGATVGMLAAALAEIDWSLTLHGISETDYPAGLLLPEKLEAAAFVAIASRFMLAQAMRVSNPLYWPKFHIVRCGIDPARMPERRKPIRQASDPFRIVCVGRLSPEKGYAVFAGALASLRVEGRSITVDIIGDGPASDSIMKTFVDRGVADMVVWHGALEEIATLEAMASADALVLPSLMEGLPVVLIEAMAIGVPVVASLVAGIPELVEHEATGLTFTPTDQAALATAIARLIEQPDLAERLAVAGRSKVKEEFTIERSAHKMLALFQKIIPT